MAYYRIVYIYGIGRDMVGTDNPSIIGGGNNDTYTFFLYIKKEAVSKLKKKRPPQGAAFF